MDTNIVTARMDIQANPASTVSSGCPIGLLTGKCIIDTDYLNLITRCKILSFRAFCTVLMFSNHFLTCLASSGISISYEKAGDWPNKNRTSTVQKLEKSCLFFKLLELTALVSGKITSVYCQIFEILGQKRHFFVI